MRERFYLAFYSNIIVEAEIHAEISDADHKLCCAWIIADNALYFYFFDP